MTNITQSPIAEVVNHAKDQAAAQFSSIVDMLAAVNCDYDRLYELRNEDYEEMAAADKDELQDLEKQAFDNEDEDQAREAIQNDPLSVEVRSSWQSVGKTLEASEFMILLCTGGPAVRIVGELNEHNEPEKAWLEYQDWCTPWTRYFEADQSVLVEYACHFYFGE